MHKNFLFEFDSFKYKRIECCQNGCYSLLLLWPLDMIPPKFTYHSRYLLLLLFLLQYIFMCSKTTMKMLCYLERNRIFHFIVLLSINKKERNYIWLLNYLYILWGQPQRQGYIFSSFWLGQSVYRKRMKFWFWILFLLQQKT